jgi:hypothetical protein
MKLSMDDREQLNELLDQEGWKVLVEQVLPQLIEAKRERVFTQPLTKSDDFTNLALLVTEIEGARKLAADVRELKKFLKTVGS